VYCGKHFAILYQDFGFDKKIVETKQMGRNRDDVHPTADESARQSYAGMKKR